MIKSSVWPKQLKETSVIIGYSGTWVKENLYYVLDMEERIKEIILDLIRNIPPDQLLNNNDLKYWVDNFVNPYAEKILELWKKK